MLRGSDSGGVVSKAPAALKPCIENEAHPAPAPPHCCIEPADTSRAGCRAHSSPEAFDAPSVHCVCRRATRPDSLNSRIPLLASDRDSWAASIGRMNRQVLEPPRLSLLPSHPPETMRLRPRTSTLEPQLGALKALKRVQAQRHRAKHGIGHCPPRPSPLTSTSPGVAKYSPGPPAHGREPIHRTHPPPTSA
jgi:hypothetical protein